MLDHCDLEGLAVGGICSFDGGVFATSTSSSTTVGCTSSLDGGISDASTGSFTTSDGFTILSRGKISSDGLSCST
ncbi:hypothetical protein ACH5RR_039342 [Cinchona calisaya]|uniref:Uncharacterized protein n=1 Tax=Cinchona calisaya TaxID=153742 RepID=A0ABD2XY09_9GENT